MATSHSGPLVIHILVPLATHTSPCFSAWQLMEPTTSEPAPGSDMARAPTRCPDTSPGRYFSSWGGLPLRRRLSTHRLECSQYDGPPEAEAREISPRATR